MDICFQVTHLPWLTHTSFFKLSSLQIKTSSSISNWSKQQPSNHVDGQPPLTLCVSCSSLILHACMCISSCHLSLLCCKMEKNYCNKLSNFWFSDWLVEYMGGGVGERKEICLLSIKCQLTKYDNFIILNPVLLQKESLQDHVKISQISQMFCFGYLSANPLPDLTQAN